jgi:Smr domain
MRRQPEEEPEGEDLPSVDLHGLSPDAALKRLEMFLHSARVRGLKQVAVVTGRGLSNATGKPVLRERIEAWCRSPLGRARGVGQVERISKGGALKLALLPAAPRPSRPT